MAVSSNEVVTPTLTLSFGLPLTGILKRDLEPYLINAYIFDNRLGDFEASEYSKNHVFILLRYSADSYFTKNVEGYIESLGNYKASYDVYKGNFVMFVVEVVDLFQKDYELFRKGLYSKISKDGQVLIKQSAKPNGIAVQILRKDKKLKDYQEERLGVDIGDMEVWSKPTISAETFTETALENIIKAYNKKGVLM